ncbi:hemolysin-III channel protein-like protein Izh2, partial [Aureobasidium pullulans]
MTEKQQRRDLDGRTTLTWSQFPEIWRRRDNIHLLRGLFHIHNETVNIWTHLLGIPMFLLFGFHLWMSVSTQYSSSSNHDIVVFGCFFAGVTICLSLSSAFHTFSAHSKDAHDHFLLLDFMGILALIAGSWIPGIYYGFYCHSTASQIYWSMICTITTICAMVIAIPYCRTPAWKPFRTSMFITLGLSGIIPMTYAAKTFGIAQANLQMGWKYIILEGIFYLCGA